MNEATPARLDVVTLAVLKGRLEQIADEMDATLYRSAFKPIIAEARDACHGVYDAITGDTFLFNDPYGGGTHLNDFRLVRPIF
ncbi:MAG: hydantoinase B/oxoprolinase family protein, partial [bacterium]